MLRYLIITGITFWSLFCIAQQTTTTLRGTVKDMETRQPVSGISVSVNNTTYSTQTEKDGTFRLSNIPLPAFELTFSAINYETRLIQLDADSAIKQIDVFLQKSTAILDEVIVAAVTDKNNWPRYGSTFRKDFLSYSPFSQKCEILNYGDIRFSNNKKDNILKAYSRVPIKIRNNALGYELTYRLEEYQHQFIPQIVLFKGYTQFTEMKGSRRKQEQWKKNRNTAYYGSLTHFLKALYEGNTTTEGYIVHLIKTIAYKDLQFYMPASADTIQASSIPQKLSSICQNRSDSAVLKMLTTKAVNWSANHLDKEPFSFSLNNDNTLYNVYFFIKDSLKKDQAFIYKFEIKDLQQIGQIQWQTAGSIIPDMKTIAKIKRYAIISPEQAEQQKVKLFYSQPANVNNFIIRKDGNIYLQFEDSWQITYTKETQEAEYIKEHSLPKENAGYQISLLSMTTKTPVRILPNGYYTDTYSLVTGAYWSYEKTDKMLPLDFIP